MNPADRNAPLSPVSVGGSEWAFAKFQGNDDGPFPNRGNLASPPSSGGSPENMSMNGYINNINSPRSAGGPSPPPSVGRYSNGTNMYPRNDDPRGGSRPEADEIIFAEHYRALRVFTQRDPSGRQPNKARDKLVRLSYVQFLELSTDVFDELLRRQALARTPPNAPQRPPNYLLPEASFHPKRNQARQRLSCLGHPRFRDLGADIFYELERRFPHFVGSEIPRVGSSMSNRSGPMGRMGTPVNGGAFPPRGESRMRRPSEADSTRGGGPPPMEPYGHPTSPGIANGGDYGRPMPRQPNQKNTIVPNKSTMIEEDDEAGDTFNPDESIGNGEIQRMSAMTSETDKKIIEDYQVQVRELRDKLDSMEDSMKKKEDEMTAALDLERSRATTLDSEKKEWQDIRSSLESKLSEAQTLNDSMKQELDRVREEHDQEISGLREQAQQSARQSLSGDSSEELKQENEKLRHSLQQQQRVTEEVRSEAQEFMREMRVLSQQSESTYEKQAEMEKSIEQLEREVRDWRNRYARTKTQLRNMKASSGEPTLNDADAARSLRDEGFLDVIGLVKDVHVTKFQIAVDELLRRARQAGPEEVMDAMKSVVVSVRRITRDIDESTPHGSGPNQRSKPRAKVSATANSLITASKTFASSAGIAPVSLIDVAASHLTGAIVDLLRVVKIRPTPAAELEDEEDQSVTPIDSAAFFSPHDGGLESTTHDPLPPPPSLQGLTGVRASASSAYSPVSSPRASVDEYPKGLGVALTNGADYADLEQDVQNNVNGYGMHGRDNGAEDLKIYLEDQNALLVSDIQSLVNCVRSEATMAQISAEIDSISVVVDKMISETQSSGYGNAAMRLDEGRGRLLDAQRHGQELAASGVGSGDGEWRSWVQTLPPMAFEIARESRELVQRVGTLTSPEHDADDFS